RNGTLVLLLELEGPARLMRRLDTLARDARRPSSARAEAENETSRPGATTVVGSLRAPRGMREIPALDGLRGVPVLAVRLYHGGFSWRRGGLLGGSTV